jgi:hypothetical protein
MQEGARLPQQFLAARACPHLSAIDSPPVRPEAMLPGFFAIIAPELRVTPGLKRPFDTVLGKSSCASSDDFVTFIYSKLSSS